MIRLIFFLLFSLAVILPGSVEEPVTLDLDNPDLIKFLKTWRYQPGDDPSRILPDFDDTDWQQVSLYTEFNQKERGNHSYRKHIRITGKLIEGKKFVLRIRHIPQAYELYWDGRLIHSNGTVGIDRETEVVGNYSTLIVISKESLNPGDHLLALRVSNHSRKIFYKYINFYAGYASRMASGTRYYQDKNLLFVGIYLTALLFTLALFMGGDRNHFYLFFILYCLLKMADAVFNYTVETIVISINTFVKILLLSNINGFLYGFILVTFLLFFLEMNQKIRHLLIIGGMAFIIQLTGLHHAGRISIIEMWTYLYSMILLVKGVRAKKPGSLIMLIAFSLPTVILVYRVLYTIIPGIYLRPTKFLITIAGGLFIAAVMLGISTKIRWETRRIEKIKLRAHRLETELLKKNIQPHFIMNTLQSIKSLIAVDKERAEGLIQSLADEFRLINRIHSRSAIPIKDEIILCLNHLKLMGYRREAQYDLEVSNSCGVMDIPPMIILTLIENGLTHAFDPQEPGKFHLSCHEDSGSVIIILKNNGSKLKEFSSLPAGKIEEGLGLKYVRARLEERFDGRWKLVYGMVDLMWQVEITIFEQTEA